MAPPGRSNIFPVTLREWRDRYEAMTMVVARGKPRGPVRISSELGPAGIDQAVFIPREPLTIRVRGRVISGKARLILGWLDNGRVHERERALKLRGGSQTIRFHPPTGAQPLHLKVGIAQLTPGGIIELDAVGLRVRGRQLLRNSELITQCRPPETRDLAEACVVRGFQTVDPDLVPVALVGWRDRYEAMAMVVPRAKPRGPVRISSELGAAGIDQAVLIPRAALTITVRGRVISGKARLILGWIDNGRVQERERALKLRDGSQTIRFRPPPGTQPLLLTVGVAQLTPGGVIELDAVALQTRKGVLRNGQLSPHLCLPTRPADLQRVCVTHRYPRDANHALVIVPGWRERYEGMAVLVERTRMDTVSPPIQFAGERPAGIDQTLRLPRSPLIVTVHGRRLAAPLVLIASWTEGGVVREQEQALKLVHGVERHRFVLPRGKGRLSVSVAIVQPEAGESASLDALSLETEGKQRLENAHLYADRCLPSPVRPNAAFAGLAWARVASTFLLLSLVGFGIHQALGLRETRP